MNIAGATLRLDDVRLLATMLDGELAAKLERAVAHDNSIVAVNFTDPERIVAVELAVATAAEAMPGRLARGGGDRGDAGEACEGSLGADTAWV